MAAHIPQWSVGAMSGATAAATLGAADAADAARVRSDAPRLDALVVDIVDVADGKATAAVISKSWGVAARGRAVSVVAVAAAT